MHLEKKKQKKPIPIKEHIFPWIFFLGIWKVFVCLFLFDQLTCQRVGWKLISNTIRRKQLKSFRQRAEIWWITKICKWNKNSGEGGGKGGGKKENMEVYGDGVFGSSSLTSGPHLKINQL